MEREELFVYNKEFTEIVVKMIEAVWKMSKLQNLSVLIQKLKD